MCGGESTLSILAGQFMAPTTSTDPHSSTRCSRNVAGSDHKQHTYSALACRLVLSGLLTLIFTSCNALRVNGVLDRITPSNDREWSPDLARTAYATIDETQTVTLHNIRNCQYVTETDYTVKYSDRQFKLSDVEGVDFIVVPFNNAQAIAHTMLSFRLRDNTYIGCSIEIRSEKGENYNPLLGTTRQYELMYLFADERDIIRLRTRFRDAEVYVYPTVATPEGAQRLLVNVLDRANELARNPEFYNTITNNCTTNLAGHVNTVVDNKINYNWRVLLPGFSAEYAYKLGFTDQ